MSALRFSSAVGRFGEQAGFSLAQCKPVSSDPVSARTGPALPNGSEATEIPERMRAAEGERNRLKRNHVLEEGLCTERPEQSSGSAARSTERPEHRAAGLLHGAPARTVGPGRLKLVEPSGCEPLLRTPVK
ncbi:hypothetical protein NQZ68_037052 [Dissostichus eleginoides]|nr:hypothetical protein NQZ68_037052 [Dissostichus eleginoides]